AIRSVLTSATSRTSGTTEPPSRFPSRPLRSRHKPRTRCACFHERAPELNESRPRINKYRENPHEMLSSSTHHLLCFVTLSGTTRHHHAGTDPSATNGSSQVAL